jgi:hypothetical protein
VRVLGTGGEAGRVAGGRPGVPAVAQEGDFVMLQVAARAAGVGEQRPVARRVEHPAVPVENVAALPGYRSAVLPASQRLGVARPPGRVGRFVMADARRPPLRSAATPCQVSLAVVGNASEGGSGCPAGLGQQRVHEVAVSMAGPD